MVGLAGLEPAFNHLEDGCPIRLDHSPILTFGAGRGSRTPNLQFRKLPLYPIELHPLLLKRNKRFGQTVY